MPKYHKIRKLLIANRGEIARRIRRTSERLGIATVQALSESDEATLFARESNEKVVIGAGPANESYLNIERIVAAARSSGADAVHPGYGFLSENPDFAQAVRDAGLCFIGPSAESIRLLGNKIAARELAKRAGVPTTPGLSTLLDDEALILAALEVGFPIIIKAAAGGGGRGMRVVNNETELRQQLPRAHAEAQKFFGDATVFFEKFIAHPRHVEVQLFGDTCGNVVHLGTRDCSTQRRNQKLVEEAPAPDLLPSLRQALHEAAVAVARSAGYYNAGTAEFLVSGEQFYFLEMNTRIQVEHPITEQITGLDLVEWQIRVAQGERLPLTQEQILFSGHAIEFRLYAENPAQAFSPSIGEIKELQLPSFPWCRNDVGYSAGDSIGLHYDAMIGKIVVSAADRPEALRRSREALDATLVSGLDCNVRFHQWLLRLSPFCAAPLSIDYIGAHFTANDLDGLTSALQRDPAFIEAPEGAEHLEWLSYSRDERVLIRIRHRRDGVFVATPVFRDGSVASPQHRRSSNGRATAIRAVIEEVLDRQLVTDLFPQAV